MNFKALFRYPLDIRKAEKLLRSGGDARELLGRAVVLDLMSERMLIDMGRHLCSFAQYAKNAGSACILRCSRLILSGVARKKYGRMMLAQSNVTWISQRESIPHNSLVLSDELSEADRISLLIGSDIHSEMPVMPFPMHPCTEQSLADHHLPSLRDSPRRMRILFAGNQNTKYDRSQIKKKFGLLTRTEVLSHLHDVFAAHVSSSLNTTSVTNNDSDHSIVLVDSQSTKIDSRDWLPTLAAADFFLCPPGASQPMCHNLIEAMSVGTIPILQYGDRVVPALVDSENAVCFDSRASLRSAIDKVMAMPETDIAKMRENVSRHYDQHMCGSKFFRELRDGQQDLSRGQLCLPFHHSNLYTLDDDVRRLSPIAA